MKRARRTILGVVFTLGMILVMMPAMVTMADNIITKEEIIKNSTVYAGEIFVDGVSKIQYVYSTDITLTKVVFNNLKDALKDTIFSDLIPGITTETTPVNGFFRYKNNSQETIQTKYKAEQNYFGGIDEDWSSAKTVASKSYTGTVNTETEKNLYSCEVTTVIYTSVNVTSQKSAAADKAAADKAAADKAARDAAAQASQAPASEPVTIMKAPAGVKAKGKKGKAIVSWKKIRKNKAGKKLLAQIRYTEVQYATDPAFTQNVGTRNVGKNKTKATLKLPRKTTYYVRVRYVGSDGVSNWSAVKKVTTK